MVKNIEKQKDKLIFFDFFDPESNCLDRICVILIGIKTTRKGVEKRMTRNDYIQYIEQALQSATPEQLTKIYSFLHALLG